MVNFQTRQQDHWRCGKINSLIVIIAFLTLEKLNRNPEACSRPPAPKTKKFLHAFFFSRPQPPHSKTCCAVPADNRLLWRQNHTFFLEKVTRFDPYCALLVPRRSFSICLIDIFCALRICGLKDITVVFPETNRCRITTLPPHNGHCSNKAAMFAF